MTIYKFLPAIYALQALQTFSVRVSRLDNLNDLFDCSPELHYPAKTVNLWKSVGGVNRLNQAQEKQRVERIGLLSYSADPTSILLWSHYGDGHRGIALGFDFDVGSVKFETWRGARRVSKIKGLS